MKDFVVYTAISKGYDDLQRPPLAWMNEADFVAFVEEPHTDVGWEIRQLHQGFDDPCRNAKIHKILAHKYFPITRYSLWVDGSVRIVSNTSLHVLVEQYLTEHDLAVFKHRRRNCIYEEGAYCVSHTLDSRPVIESQLSNYRNLGYPSANGLAECTVLLRRHTDEVRLFNEMWYHEIQTHSRRDQLSFNFVAHKLGFKYAYFQGNISSNPHFKWLQNHASRDKARQVLAQAGG